MVTRKMGNRLSRKLGYENLEQRRLLAADLAVDIMPCDVELDAAQQFEVAPEIADDSAGIDLVIEAATDATNDQSSFRVQELDLSDGSDGVFGSIDQDNATPTFSFTPEADGTVGVVVTSSFGDASTNLEIRNAEGELLSAASTDGLDGFQTLRMNVNAGESYQLTISSDAEVEGNFQLTVGFQADQATDPIVDQADPEVDADLEPELAGGEETDSQPPSDSTQQDVDNGPAEEPQSEIDTVVDNESDEAEMELEVTNTDSDDGSVADENETVGSEPVPTPVPQPEEISPENQPQPITDLHSDEIGENSTSLAFESGSTTINGQLEQAGDVDTFRFTAEADGTVDLFLGDTTTDGDLDLNVNVYNAYGEELLDGATNEIVQLALDVAAGSEYFVSVSADQDQVGEYALQADFVAAPQPVDDHANEIGNEATALIFNDGTWTGTGELETAQDQDAFRFTADCNETFALAMNVDSPNNQSDAMISVFDSSGELLAQGTTNDGVELIFETSAGSEYQILVDSINDSPMSFELTAKPIGTLPSEPSAILSEAAADELTEYATEFVNPTEPVDQVFENLGADELSANSEMASMRDQLDLYRTNLMRFAR